MTTIHHPNDHCFLLRTKQPNFLKESHMPKGSLAGKQFFFMSGVKRQNSGVPIKNSVCVCVLSRVQLFVTPWTL